MTKLDGLGRRIVQIIDGEELFTAISDTAVAGTALQQKVSIQRAAHHSGADSFVLDGAGLDKKKLVWAFAAGLNQDASAAGLDSEQCSFYRAACEAVTQLKRIVVAIHRAQHAEREALSMLSRVSGFARRNELVFKVILIGDIPQLTENAYFTGIRVDRFIPRKKAADAYDERSRQMFSVQEFTQVI